MSMEKVTWFALFVLTEATIAAVFQIPLVGDAISHSAYSYAEVFSGTMMLDFLFMVLIAIFEVEA